LSVVTNVDVYLAIAEEAHAKMRADLARLITPKPAGEPGYIMRSDPDRRSYKSAMVTVVFGGMYLEALLYITLQERFGRTDALKIDRKHYEERLTKLGITDVALHKRVKAFREARKDLVHEKAVTLDNLHDEAMHVAQDTADSAMSLLHDLRALLGASKVPGP
jgi:hypothetical protein